MKKKLYILIPTIIVICLLIGVSIHYYNEYQKLKANPQIISQLEQNEVLSKIQQFMELPSDESPVIATVTDLSKLKGQSFFIKAKNQDKVLIYQKNQLAILYRPATNRIINVAPLVIGTGNQEGQDGGKVNPTNIPKK